jgi:importin subunit alpha-1
VDAVVHLINNTKCKKTLVQGAWALSNLCRGHPLPDYEKIEKAIPILCKIVKLKVLDE